MALVGSFEAKTHLSALLERVTRGEQITITKHGVPIARLVPVNEGGKTDPKAAVAALKELRRGVRLNGLSVRDLIEEGRLS